MDRYFRMPGSFTLDLGRANRISRFWLAVPTAVVAVAVVVVVVQYAAFLRWISVMSADCRW